MFGSFIVMICSGSSLCPAAVCDAAGSCGRCMLQAVHRTIQHAWGCLTAGVVFHVIDYGWFIDLYIDFCSHRHFLLVYAR